LKYLAYVFTNIVFLNSVNSVCKDTLPCNHRGSMDYLIQTGPICRCSRKFYVGCEDGTTRHLSTFRSGSRDVRKSPRCILWSPAASLGLGSPPHLTPRQHRKEFSVGNSTKPGALKTGWWAPEWPRCGGCGVGGMQLGTASWLNGGHMNHQTS
jgi:hypothetical protein